MSKKIRVFIAWPIDAYNRPATHFSPRVFDSSYEFAKMLNVQISCGSADIITASGGYVEGRIKTKISTAKQAEKIMDAPLFHYLEYKDSDTADGSVVRWEVRALKG